MDSYDQTSVGFSTGVGYALSEDLIQKFSYSFSRSKIDSKEGTEIKKDEEVKKKDEEVKKKDEEESISKIIQNQRGTYFRSSLTHKLFYDRLDSRFFPSNGHYLEMRNTFSGLGGNVKYFRTDFEAKYYKTLLKDLTLSFKGSAGFVRGFGKHNGLTKTKDDKVNLLVTDHIRLGDSDFRGFEFGGLGPRDMKSTEKDALGGRQYIKGTAEALFPIGLPKEVGVRMALFTDVGTVYNSVFKGKHKIYDDHFVRVSAGVGILWESPMGPIRIDYAIPFRVKKDKAGKKIDKTQRIHFGFSTNF